jgi:hypothetical protein
MLSSPSGDFMFTVRLCVPLTAAGPLLGDMRAWLDRERALAAAVHFHEAPAGVEIEISFDEEHHAQACAEYFHGLLLVTG